MTVIPFVTGALGMIPKALVREVENQRMSQDHPNYSIIEISQNTKKSPGDLKRLTVTPTPVKDQQLALV